MSIISIVGARPNFMKMSPVINELNQLGMNNILVHTGQHYDWNMSKVFFNELSIPKPDIFLNIGSGTHAVQTAKIMIEFESICAAKNPALVIVAGDVNSTLACALVAAKMNIPIAHIEAGLRSFDQTMPEEINRILTDRISDLLFISEGSGIKNLKKEGVQKNKMFFVGNCMIDSVKKYIDKALERQPWLKLNLAQQNYCLVTMHRPSNVDSPESLLGIISMLNDISKSLPVVFPVHPRTKNNLDKLKVEIKKGVSITEPMPYLEFLGFLARAKIVITDSGGIQEETTYLNVQCLTFRENTERPETVITGTNHLVGTKTDSVIKKVNEILNGKIKIGSIPERWDGNSAKSISKVITKFLR